MDMKRDGWKNTLEGRPQAEGEAHLSGRDMNSGGMDVYGGEKICVGEKPCGENHETEKNHVTGEKPCDSVTLTNEKRAAEEAAEKPWNSSLQDGERSFL